MICPKCRSEFVEGISECPECRVKLVEALSTEEPEFIEYEAVLSTFNPGDIAFIKSLLDSEDIPYFIKGENFNIARPMVEPAIVMVDKQHAAEVKQLLEEVDLAFMTLNLRNKYTGE